MLRKSARWVIVVAGLVLALVAALFLWRGGRLPTAARLKPEDVVKFTVGLVKMEDEGLFTAQPQQVAEVNDPKVIRRFLLLLRTARKTQTHKCGDTGSVVFELASGNTYRIGITPGHNARFYEVSMPGRQWKLERKEFLATLKEAGVPKVSLNRTLSGKKDG